VQAHPALLLNADYRPLSYFPLSTVPWQTAVKLRYEDVVAVVAEYDTEAHSPSVTMRLPSVIALRNYQPAPKHIAFTRFNVFLRDRFRCQYCGARHKSVDLTFDHVIPRSKGGQTTWENIVAACWPCNMAKDDRHLTPLRWPTKPTARELMAAQREFPPNYLHESWLDYLYWDSEIGDVR
jgi:5-methylcytosine-specific restriction endonuclease McrA